MSRKDSRFWMRAKTLLGTAVVCASLAVGAMSVFAAGSVSVTADKASAGVSETVTVKVQTSDPEDPAMPPAVSVNFDPSILQFESCDVEYGGGDGGLVTINGTSATLTFTTLAAGSANVSAEAVIDEDGNNPATGAATITVGGGADAAPASGADATLRGLAIDPGVLSPAFSPNVTDYTITVEEGVTDITVSGGVSDSSSQITAANGFKNLSEGESEAQITVTAADGTTMTYHFKIVRGDTAAAAAAVTPAEPEATAEPAADTAAAPQSGDNSGFVAGAGLGGIGSKGNDMTILVGKNSYTIQPVVNDALLPSGSSKTTTPYGSQTNEAVTFGDLLLVDAKSNVDGSEKLFLYDSEADAFQGFVKIESGNGSYIIPKVLPKSLPSGFIADGADLGGAYVACGKLKDSSVDQRENVCLIYGVDQNGTDGYFLYDISAGGYVHFLNTGAAAGGTFSKRAIAIIVLLGVLLVICLIIMLVMAVGKGEYPDYPDELEDPLFEDVRNYDTRKPEKTPAGQASVRTVKKKVVAEPEPEEEDLQEDMPEPTVRKVKKTRPATRPALSEDMEDFDINREIESMKENAVKKSATARMENMEAALKNRSTTRTVMPQQSTPVKNAEARSGAVRTKKPVRSVRSEEITIDKPVRKPVAKPATQAGGEARPKVTKTVTEKGVTYNTGKIPITVVKSTKAPASEAKGSVPIFTLGKESSLSRESLPDEPDTDFKFDFIDLDKKDE